MKPRGAAQSGVSGFELDGPANIVLRLEGISKSFGGLQVLKDVDLAVGESELVGLIGPNGAGKSTLFNVITSLYKPNRGDVYFYGKKITGQASYRTCHMGISRTFQLVKIVPSLTALENVMVGAIFGHEHNAEGALDRALAALDVVQMAAKKDRIAARMTFSDRRLLEVARALASMPAVMLLDEPMAGLNSSEIGKMLQVIDKVRKERKVSILWVEHKVDAIFRLSDRVVVLHHGGEDSRWDTVGDRENCVCH